MFFIIINILNIHIIKKIIYYILKILKTQMIKNQIKEKAA